MAPGERRKLLLQELASRFGKKAAAPAYYFERNWSLEKWTRGCYGAFLTTGAHTRLGPAIRAPVGRIHWAGTETATVWYVHMDGAVRSGERAAEEVLTTR
jgi:monoamine oxidase